MSHASDSVDIFTKIEHHAFTPSACPLCGGAAELWERQFAHSVQKVVCCPNAEPDECPLYFPPLRFYCATKGAAVAVWEEMCAESRAASPYADSSPELRSLVAFILANSGQFKWSLQGLGMLRLHMGDETRLHVWDTRYAFPGASPIHDHLQWGLRSTVISGRITNQRYIERDDGRPYHFAVIKAGYNYHFKTEPREIRLVETAPEIYTPGMSYSQAPSEIHQSMPDIGTVTIMRKSPTADGESARIFWPLGSEWGSAEPRAALPSEVSVITGNALSLMQTGKGLSA